MVWYCLASQFLRYLYAKLEVLKECHHLYEFFLALCKLCEDCT